MRRLVNAEMSVKEVLSLQTGSGVNDWTWSPAMCLITARQNLLTHFSVSFYFFQAKVGLWKGCICLAQSLQSRDKLFHLPYRCLAPNEYGRLHQALDEMKKCDIM